MVLAAHKLRAPDTSDGAFVFATRTGRALSQRNVMRELRRSQRRATDQLGRRVFPALHELDADGAPVCTGKAMCACKVKVPPGSVPSIHGFRHTAASLEIRDGTPVEEVAWMLGHKDATVTRAVYLHEVRDAERRTKRRERQRVRAGSVLEAAKGSAGVADGKAVPPNVAQLRP